jgi:hypothetical protein
MKDRSLVKLGLAFLVAAIVSTSADAHIFGRVSRSRSVAVSKTVAVQQVGVARARVVCRSGQCGVR